ncbi:MAG: tetratricopeptide repeat protein [Bryobacteraceae bacterium]
MFRFGAVWLCLGVVHAQTPRSPQEILKEAVTLQQAGKLDAAIKDYQQLVAMYPDQPQIRSNLGAALAGAGRYAEAVEQYKKAIAIQPDPQVRLNLALAYYKESEFQAAIRELEAVHQALPSNTQALMLLGDSNLQLGNNKRVIELLRPLYKSNPADLAVAYMLGTALVRDGQTAEGQLVIDPILKNGDSAEARLLMGTTKMSVHDFAGARDDLKRAVELNPNLPDVYSYYGSALLATGDQPGAEEAFKKELDHNPSNFDANLKMGVLLKQDDDLDGAMKHFGKALKARPGDVAVRYQIASVLVEQSHIEEARRQLESLVKEAPNFTEAHVTLATVYYREKRKTDGDRERKIVAQLTAERQAKEPGVRAQQ